MFGSIDAQTGNLVDLAQYQFWGVMIAVLLVMPVMFWIMVKNHTRATERMIDRLAIPIDGMKHSIDQLAQQLAASTAASDAMLKSIGEKVSVVSEDVDELKVDVGSLKSDVHVVAGTVKEHGAILEDHSAQLAGAKKPARKRGSASRGGRFDPS